VLLAAIKAEACPYTEMEPLILKKLSPLDAAWKAECASLLVSTIEASGGGDGALAGAKASPASSKSSLSDFDSPASAGASEPLYLKNEVPLVTGLKFHFFVYHPYRPLKALLREALEACASTSPPAAASSGGASSKVDTAAWDALQGRATALVDLATLTDLPLLTSPAHIALGALELACDPTVVIGGEGGLGAFSLHGPGGIPDIAASTTSTVLFPDLAAPPLASLAAQVSQWVKARQSRSAQVDSVPATTTTSSNSSSSSSGSSAGGTGGSGAGAECATVRARVLQLLEQGRSQGTLRGKAAAYYVALCTSRDQSLVPGTPQHAARLESLRALIATYKSSKAARAAAATEAHTALLLREKQDWGTTQPLPGPG